jgi:glycosidase
MKRENVLQESVLLSHGEVFQQFELIALKSGINNLGGSRSVPVTLSSSPKFCPWELGFVLSFGLPLTRPKANLKSVPGRRLHAQDPSVSSLYPNSVMIFAPPSLPSCFRRRTTALVLLAATAAVSLSAQESEIPLHGLQPATTLPAWMNHGVIYEVNVRQYSEAGTFDAVTADLDRLAELGVTTLWFMPIHPIGEVNRKGPLGSYYAISDYQAVNPEFGTAEDFAELVEAAHAREMRVILDWVGNHTAWDNPLTETHPEFFAKDCNGELMPPTGTDWTDVIQLDFEAPGLLEYKIGVLNYWIEEFGVDGYRCDFATGVPTPFWEKLTGAVLDKHPETFFLAEAEVADQQLEAFHANYGWTMLSTFQEVAQGKASANAIDNVLARMSIEFPQGARFLYFTTNHDENSWQGTVQQRFGGAANVFSVLSFTLDGIPLLYNGQEAGMDKRLEFFERDPIDWRPHPNFAFFETLIDLKKAAPALAVGAPFRRLASTEDDVVYAFQRGEGADALLVLTNLQAHDSRFALAIGADNAGVWEDIFTHERLTLNALTPMELESWGFRILQRAD